MTLIARSLKNQPTVARNSTAVLRLRGRERALYWLAFFSLIVFVLILRLISYRFSLPFIDHPDEPTLYLKALEWRGLHDLHGYAEGYPPGTVAIHWALQQVMEPLGVEGVSNAVKAMRLLSVGVNTTNLAFLIATASLIGGRIAGLLTGVAWAVSPMMLREGVYGTADPWLYCLTTISLFLAVAATLLPHRRWWSVPSVIVGLIAVLFKYPIVPAVGPGVLVALYTAYKSPSQGRRYLAIQAVLIAVFFVALFWFYNPLRFLESPSGITRELDQNGILNWFIPRRVLGNIYYALEPLNFIVLTLVVVFGAAAYVIARRRGLPTVRADGVGLTAFLIITIPWAVAYIDITPAVRIRDVVSATTVAFILLGVGLAQISYLFRNRSHRTTATSGLVALLSVFVFLPNLASAVELVKDRNRGDHRADVRAWADAVLDPGTVLVEPINQSVFNRFWGNSEGTKWFDWWEYGSILEHSIEEWRSEFGMSYAIITKDPLEAIPAIPGGREALDNMLHLRDFHAPPDKRGPEMSVFRLWPPQENIDAQFGEIVCLKGYDISASEVTPGQTITVQLYWQPLAQPTENYSVFLHLIPADDYTILSQVDGAPGTPDRPTQLWNEPSETIISQPFELPIPADLPPGQYRIGVGLYNYETFIRLPVTDEAGRGMGDWLLLVDVTITEETANDAPQLTDCCD